MPRTKAPALPFPMPSRPKRTPKAADRLHTNENPDQMVRKRAERGVQTKANQNIGLPSENVSTKADPADAQDADLARETLRAVCRDGAAPAAARAQAARTLAEMASALGRHAAPPAPTSSKPLSAMTMAELQAELARNGG